MCFVCVQEEPGPTYATWLLPPDESKVELRRQHVRLSGGGVLGGAWWDAQLCTASVSTHAPFSSRTSFSLPFQDNAGLPIRLSNVPSLKRPAVLPPLPPASIPRSATTCCGGRAARCRAQSAACATRSPPSIQARLELACCCYAAGCCRHHLLLCCCAAVHPWRPALPDPLSCTAPLTEAEHTAALLLEPLRPFLVTADSKGVLRISNYRSGGLVNRFHAASGVSVADSSPAARAAAAGGQAACVRALYMVSGGCDLGAIDCSLEEGPD